MLSAKKVIATIFWNHQCVLLVDILSRKANINATCYSATLDRLRKTIRQKRTGLLSRGVILLHDNMLQPAYGLRYTWFATALPIECIGRSPRFLYTVISRPLKKHLAGRHFHIDAEVQDNIVKLLSNQGSDFFTVGFNRLI